jgi:very-short-patch-repair endonuclease
MTRRARVLRKNATKAERLLWSRLRRNAVEGFDFRRHLPVCGYIADFVYFEAKLIVEVDGATRSSSNEAAADERRDARLGADGFLVTRIVDDDGCKILQGVQETIRMTVLEANPTCERKAG